MISLGGALTDGKSALAVDHVPTRFPHFRTPFPRRELDFAHPTNPNASYAAMPTPCCQLKYFAASSCNYRTKHGITIRRFCHSPPIDGVSLGYLEAI